MFTQRDVLGVARLLRPGWDAAWHVMGRAVARGPAAKPLTVPAHGEPVEIPYSRAPQNVAAEHVRNSVSPRFPGSTLVNPGEKRLF
ncbi:hypothetical protein MSM1_17180 [Mycobacterium sp. SM1]|uniref:hypothetical protein n=1 Tax=Mycobacterium sp. SM1 TaxID=2816243 RepID=UPI001BD00F2A|nr:hypothetical protein [Mycobacterium sp. SM1]MBS4730001.1 hypothetical protein [Mycobacterium sp. SM1]